MKLFIILLILGLNLVGCSKTTKVKAEISFLLNTQALVEIDGGLIVFGKNSTTNDRFVRTVSSGQSSIEEELTIGTWEIGAMGWKGDSEGTFTGDVKCGLNNPVAVTTGPVTFNINLSNAKCFNGSMFDEAGTGSVTKRFFPIRPEFCNGDLSPLSGSSSCSYDISNNVNLKSIIGSYKIDLIGSRNYKGAEQTLPLENLSSSCFQPNATMSVDGTKSLSSINIPKMLSGRMIPFRVVSYMSNDCTLTKGAVARSLTDLVETKVEIDSASNSKKIFSKITNNFLCDLSNSLDITTSFASGTGTTTNPYLICNIDQFYLLQTNYATNNTKSFLLGADINLLRGISAGSTSTPFDSCLEDGNTFVPIGYSINAICEMTPPTVGFFSGQLDGDNHQILHFRFKMKKDSVGLFSKVSGASFARLNLSRFEIEGEDEVGALAGSSTGTSTTLDNIRVEGLSLRGESNLGGVIGSIAMGNISNLHVSKAKIRGKSNNIGGVIGISSADISMASFDGNIVSEATSLAPSSQVGGIVGSGMNVDQAVSTGVITGQLYKAGGIMGIGNSISYSRSEILINDRSESATPRNFGGLIGYTSSGVISRSYFMGNILSGCATSCNIGAFSGSGGTVDTMSRAYISYNNSGIDDSNSYGISSFTSFNTPALKNSLCAVTGNSGTAVPGCLWEQDSSSGDIARLSFEDHICEQTINNSTLSVQKSFGLGTVSNPLVVCKPSQLSGLTITSDTRKIIIGKNINMLSLSSTNSLATNNLVNAVVDGQGATLHSFTPALSGTGAFTGIVGDISSTSVIRNLNLVGFKISASTCTNCIVAPLSRKNEGVIENIRVTDSNFDTTSSTTSLSGLVGENYPLGSIRNVYVEAELSGLGSMAGVTSRNQGLIELAESRANIKIIGNSGSSIGGIVGHLDSGKIKRSEFHGEIQISAQGSMIGGIAGKVTTGTQLGSEISNSLVSSESRIKHEYYGATYIGGLVGYTQLGSSAFTFSKVIFNGTMTASTSTSATSSIGPLLPPGLTASPSAVYDFRPLFKGLDIVNVGTMTFTSGVCTLPISTYSYSTAISGLGAVGGSNLKILSGTITHNSVNSYTLDSTDAKEYNDCENYQMSLNSGYAGTLYQAAANPNPQTVAQLKTNGFDLVDIENNATDADRAFSVYLANLNGTPTTTVSPIWELGEDGPQLFKIED